MSHKVSSVHDAVVAVATKLFATEGYAEVSIARLADEAKVSVSGLQRAFLTKEHVLQAVVAAASARLNGKYRDDIMLLKHDGVAPHVSAVLAYARMILDFAGRVQSEEQYYVINLFGSIGKTLPGREHLPDAETLSLFLNVVSPGETRTAQEVKCFLFGVLSEYVRDVQTGSSQYTKDVVYEMIRNFITQPITKENATDRTAPVKNLEYVLASMQDSVAVVKVLLNKA